MAVQQVPKCDVVLVASLFYLSADVLLEWEGFGSCRKPVHVWLLVSYGALLASRAAYVYRTLISSAASSGDLLPNLRRKSLFLRALLPFACIGFVPLFATWTALGTVWTGEVMFDSPWCLPSVGHYWCLVAWQVLSYVWILVHSVLSFMTWRLETEELKFERGFRLMGESDMAEQWGLFGGVDGRPFGAAPSATRACDGLSPAAIRVLPGAGLCSAAEGELEEDCPICLHPVQAGEQVRELTACGHVFHRSCVDLWLLRSASCPLCKGTVACPLKQQ